MLLSAMDLSNCIPWSILAFSKVEMIAKTYHGSGLVASFLIGLSTACALRECILFRKLKIHLWKAYQTVSVCKLSLYLQHIRRFFKENFFIMLKFHVNLHEFFENRKSE